MTYFRKLIFLFFLLSFITQQSFSQTTKQELDLGCYSVVDNFVDWTYIIFQKEATNYFDPWYDAKKFTNSDPKIPNFYTTINDTNYSVNALPTLIKDKIVNLIISAQKTGSYAITVKDTGFDNKIKIFIIDTVLNSYQNILAFKTYNFNYPTADLDKHFKLCFDFDGLGVPSSSFSALTDTISLGETNQINFTGKSSVEGIFDWYFDGANVLSGQEKGPYTVNWSTPGEKRLTLTIKEPCFKSSRTTVKVYVNDTIYRVNVIPRSNTVFCKNGSVVLKAYSEKGSLYQWKMNNVNIPGANSDSIIVRNTGSYAVLAYKNGKSYLSKSIKTLNISMPAFKIKFLGNTTFVEGKMLSLYVDYSDSLSYQWYKDGYAINNALLSSYDVFLTGKYFVQINNKHNCTVFSDTVTVTVVPKSNPLIDPSDSLSLCHGDSIKLAITNVKNVKYQWKVNEKIIEGATDSVYYASFAGAYNAVVYSLFDTIASKSVKISFIDQLFPKIFSANLAICSGDSVKIKSNFSKNINYQWYYNNMPIPYAKDSVIFASSQGWYFLRQKNLCDSVNSDSLFIKVNPLPSVNIGKDTVLCAENSIILNAASGYKHYLWSNSENTSYITVDSSGIGLGSIDVSVTVTDSLGCSASDNINISFTKCDWVSENMKNLNLSIFPNPCSSLLYVRFDNDVIKNYNFCIYNVLGEIAHFSSYSHYNNIKTINLTDLKKGIYLLRVECNNKFVNKTFIKE